MASLVPASSGWSNLNATEINDLGQNVGQGTYNGQLEAFEMTPEAVPELGTLAVWRLLTAWAGSKVIAVRLRRPQISV